MKNENKQDLRAFMYPLGGLPALRFMFESVGVKIEARASHTFNRQSIPRKYAPVVLLIKQKFNVDLMAFVSKGGRAQPIQNSKSQCMYPNVLEKLKIHGLGAVASEMNREGNKAELFPTNPPKRFNHYSLQKLLTKKLSKEAKNYFNLCWNLGKEIEADEKAQESGLLE